MSILVTCRSLQKAFGVHPLFDGLSVCLKNKLIFKEKKELESMEARILEAEQAVEECRKQVEDPLVMKNPD